jgi:nucleoside-diphosphate-sugar epimerase
LLVRGWTVRSIDIAPFDYPERPRIDAILGDIRDARVVDPAVNGVDVVVHCAAALPLASASEILSTGVQGTRVLLDAAQRHGVQRFIFISSTAVYGIPGDHPIREDEPLHGVGPYGNAKIGAERLCEDQRAGGMCVCVLRPKSFVGPERLGAFELLYDWAFDGRGFPLLGRGDNLYQLLDVEDLCDVIFLCMTLAPDAVNDTFNVGAHQFGTLRQSFQAVLDRAGHGRRVVPLAATPAVWTLRVLEALKLSPLYRWIYESASHSSVVSTQRLRLRTGFVPRYSNTDALLRNYEWYVAHRTELGARSGVTHRLPWRRGFLRLAKWFF